MPTIDVVDGIRINLYFGEHLPPHIHAVYNEFEALVIIKSRDVFSGYLPDRQMRKVLDWLDENEEFALNVFYDLNPFLK
jgi:hypothetical protein